MPTQPYDLILYGATGFTGRLVAEYLLQQYGLSGSLRWAIAGRNQQKLEEVRSQLGAEALPIVIADSLDKPSLVALAQQTRVVCTTVGPYAKYGSLLVEACAQNGTNYCDLCGEVQWMRRMIDQHHETAKANGAKIVHCCGFDSIPSDMGVYFLQKEAKTRTGAYCSQAKMRVKGASGGFSGGTYASLSNVLVEAEKDPSIFKVLLDPYGLNPQGERRGPDQVDLNKVAFDEDFQAWISPFVMATINTKVVRRSQALLGYPYGKDWRYDEATFNGSGFGNKITAHLMAFFINAINSAKPNSWFKKLLDRIFPKPGEGPSEAVREKGFFYLLFLGKFANGTQIKVKVIGDKDPGYGSTSKMLAESAVCLAKDRDQLPALEGVLTPSTAMGEALLQRLVKNAGLSFEVVD